jgi:hypothetical protein
MFLTIEQNNSGGYYIEDDKYGIGCYIIIEADNIEEAKRRLADIADNYDESQNEHSFYEYCNCCGDRWDIWYKDGTDLFEVPSIDEKPIKECYHYRNGYIHYKSGEIQYFQTIDSK